MATVTAGAITTTVTEIQSVGETILEVLEAADPAVALPAEAAGQVLTLVGDLVGKALSAYSSAAGTPITVASVLALLPNDTPLAPPPAGS